MMKLEKDPMPFFGIQTWVALPKDHGTATHCSNTPLLTTLPLIEGEGKEVRLILGNAYGERAPVETAAEMFYLDAVLEAGPQYPFPDDHEDRGAYVVEGGWRQGETYTAGKMMVFRPNDPVSLKAGPQGARVMLLGGETLRGLGTSGGTSWRPLKSASRKLRKRGGVRTLIVTHGSTTGGR